MKIPSKKILSVLFFLFYFFPFSAAADCWISPLGAGKKNGSDALNAYPANRAQICWNQTGTNETMHVLAGTYSVEEKTFWKLKIAPSSDGSQVKDYFKKIKGEGEVRIEGSRPVPYQDASKGAGETWITLEHGAGNIAIENFTISRVSDGIVAKEGANSHLQFSDLHFENTRQNIVILGHPECVRLSACHLDPHELSRGILIQNTWGLRYSKRHIRLANGVSDVRVVNSHANADFIDGDFAVGFDVENPSHDIEFSYCSSRGNIYTLSSYWNGDGFKTEDETNNIRWDHCSAFDNADAGFDIKSDNAVLENIIALRNNRNIRTWSSKKTILRNVNASYSKHQGGDATQAGIWTQGTLECYFCTVHDNQIQVHAESNHGKSKLTLYDSILSMGSAVQGEMIRQEKESQVELIRTSVWKEGQPANPHFGSGAVSGWEGGKEFNSGLYGGSKGYYEKL